MTTKIDASKINFGIIRFRGAPNKIQLPDGTFVYRLESIYVPPIPDTVLPWGMIKCAPYDDNFIFEVPKSYIHSPTYACTCGSSAVITGFSGYQQDASPQGMLFVCLQHATYGFHFNTPTRWI
jgi:hypothetical protein